MIYCQIDLTRRLQLFLPGKIVSLQRWTSSESIWQSPIKMFDLARVKEDCTVGLQESCWQKKRGYLPQ